MAPILPPLLMALGKAILASFWQVGCLWAFVSIIGTHSKRLTATQRSLLYFSGLTTAFLAFIITAIYFIQNPHQSMGLPNLFVVWPAAEAIFQFTGGFYLILLCVPFFRLMRSYGMIHQLRNGHRERVPGVLKIFALDAAQLLGIQKKVQLFGSAFISSPLTFGFLKPIILLPLAMMNQLSIRELEMIILHELAHIRRKDYLLNFCSRIMMAFLYFNPFAKLLFRELSQEREKSADNWVTQYEFDGFQYANTLLKLARAQTLPNGLTMQVAPGSDSLLKQRVANILGKPVNRNPVMGKSLIALLFFSLLGLGIQLPSKNHERFTGPAYVQQDISTVDPRLEITAVADKDVDPYKITKIPTVIEGDKKPADQTIYLKQYEDGVTGKITLPSKPAAPAASPEVLFVDHAQEIIPSLNQQDENKVQASIQQAKELVIAYNWRRIEQNLAPQVTEEEKEILKAYFTKMVNQLNWEANANRLRASFKVINWKELEQHLQKISEKVQQKHVENIGFDSSHAHITNEWTQAMARKHGSDSIIRLDSTQHTRVKKITQTVEL